MAKKTLRVGIMGATFNPVHNGHLFMANCAKIEFALDEILFIPTGRPLYKAVEIVANATDRLNMLQLACGNIEEYTVLDMEIHRPGATYSIDTLYELKRVYPENAEFYFIIGKDMFCRLDTWKNYEELLKLTAFIVFRRKDVDEDLFEEKKRFLMQKGGVFFFSGSIPMDVSSTELRSMAKKGKSLVGFVPEDVERYITENRLYA